MIGFDAAVELIRSVASPLGTETVAIADAHERVLAQPVVAVIDSPRCDVSAMDGYALREADLDRLPAELEIVGESFPGAAPDALVRPSCCVRIFTGAPVPDGADRIVMQENVRRDGNSAIIEEQPGRDRHIRPNGSDFGAGDQLLAAGTVLGPRAMVAAAAADLGEVEVYRKPHVRIFSTGDELAQPGTARRRSHAVPDSVSLGVAAMAERWGALHAGTTRLPDDLPEMRRAASTAFDEADLVVVTGGASVGEKDFAKSMFEPLGFDLIFSKVAMKPGKPVWLGRVGGKLVIGLPGNPTSALVTARLLLAPLLSGLTGRYPEQALHWRGVSIVSDLPARGARETFHRARLVDGAAEVIAFQESHAQKALADADVLVRQPANSPAIRAGEQVQVVDF
jgi:molybdopterin molybdotransferase